MEDPPDARRIGQLGLFFAYYPHKVFGCIAIVEHQGQIQLHSQVDVTTQEIVLFVVERRIPIIIESRLTNSYDSRPSGKLHHTRPVGLGRILHVTGVNAGHDVQPFVLGSQFDGHLDGSHINGGNEHAVYADSPGPCNDVIPVVPEFRMIDVDVGIGKHD